MKGLLLDPRLPEPQSPTLLTIAGVDPSSGAGITADLAVFAAHGCFGISAATALTVQSTRGVFGVQPVDPSFLADTLARLDEDLPPAGIKVGMLAGEAQTQVVVEYLQRTRARHLPVVIDPVLRSSSGAALLSDAGVHLLREQLLPMAHVVTPNRQELSILAGMSCANAQQAEEAAHLLHRTYPNCAILVTGGDEEYPDDLLVDGDRLLWLRGERIVTTATHGTGCAFSSALMCALMRGHPVDEAASHAKRYVAQAMRTAAPRGGGRGPLNLLWPLLAPPAHFVPVSYLTPRAGAGEVPPKS